VLKADEDCMDLFINCLNSDLRISRLGVFLAELTVVFNLASSCVLSADTVGECRPVGQTADGVSTALKEVDDWVLLLLVTFTGETCLLTPCESEASCSPGETVFSVLTEEFLRLF
jgi:hypothetical protein